MELQEIHKEILALCAHDYLGFWLVVKRVAKDAYSDKLPEWVRPKTLEAIRYLLQSRLIEAGNFEHKDSGSYKFQPMLLPVDEVIRYIEREWDELGRTPNISDICWFIATSLGEQLANDLGLRD